MFKQSRTRLLLTLLGALMVSSLAFAAGAGAQRPGAQRQANQNARGEQKKRVFVGRGSDSRQGSRVTITADDTLKDYSAYRSGDRFYVVLPKSAAARAGGGSGRGYSDMQVQQRGDSVVLSYRVQPGAKPRVEQKFNRLDVVFDVPEGSGQQAAPPGDAGRAQQQQQQQQAETRGQTPASQQQSQTAAPSSNNAGSAAERNAAAAEAARAQAAAAAQANNAAPPVVPAGQTPATGAADPSALPGSTPLTAQEGASPAPTADPSQLAQAQPPAAPVQITKPAEAAQTNPTGSTLGAFLMRNWALALIIALVVVGLGLVIAARRTTPAAAEGSEQEGAKPKLEESHAESRATRASESSAAALGAATANAAAAVKTSKPEAARVSTEVPANVSSEAAQKAAPEVTSEATPEVSSEATREVSSDVTPEVSSEVTPEVPAVDVRPLAAATALAGGAAAAKTRKQSRKDARRKKKGAHADKRDADATVEETAVETQTVESAAVESATVESLPVEASPAPAEVQETAVEETLVRESVVEQPVVAETEAEETAVEESAVEVAPSFEVAESPEALASEPTIVTTEPTPAEAAAAFVVSEAATASEPVAPAAEEPETSVAEPVAQSAEIEPSKEIEPAVAPDLERVSAETRQLLEGAEYDRAVIGTRDPFARQMIAAELLSALAGRNAQRRERASAAFVEQGYFDETARDLSGADAPAERAAAARSLALLGDRAATPRLIAALEDSNIEVRRAAVEALGALRDPSAVAALEALMERERNERNRIPPRVIRVAADSCRDAAAELDAEIAAVESAPAIKSAPAAVVEPEAEATVETEPPAEVAIEPAVATEQAQSFQSVAPEPTEETSVSITPFVEEARAAAEEIPAAEAQTLAAEAEAFVAHEEPAHASEVGPEAAEPRAFVHDAPEAFETAAAESQSFETPVAEPQAVVETGIRPFADAEESAAEASEPAPEVSWDFNATPAGEVALEPFVEPAEEPEARELEPSGAASDSAQAELFDGRADEEATREIAPFKEEAAPASVEAGEWFDLDVSEMREAPRPAAPPSAPEAEYETHLFESSSGEAFAPQAAADATAAYEPSSRETTPFVDTRAEVTRELDPAAAFEHAPEESAHAAVSETAPPPVAPRASDEKGIALFDEHSTVPASIQQRLASGDAAERASAIGDLSRVDTDEAFQQICAGFDDESKDVRNAAARSLYDLRADRAESFTRALREASPERRREIGAAISTSGLAVESISQLTGESRERTYEAFSLLFLMAKAGEVAPLIRAIEGHPSNEVRLAVVKLLALSGQKEILPAFRRLAVRGSLPTEVRSAVMEAIYQISSSQPTHA